MAGTLLNVVAVLVGATIGSLLGNRLPERLRATAMQGIGLFTLLIGMQMALQAQNVLIILVSVVVGGAIGAALGLEDALERLGRRLEARFGSADRDGGDDAANPFVRGFVTSSLVFCVGPMSILGPIQDGLSGDMRLLAVKSLLDGFSAVAFASVLGRGVFFAALVVLLYQGGIALAARAIGSGIADPASDPVVLAMTAAGGLVIVGIGIRLLELKKVPVVDLLPAVAIAPLLTAWVGEPLGRLLG